MLDFTPDPIAIQLGPIPVYWYGIGYALGLAAAYLVMVRLARRAGEDWEILANAMIVVAVAALIGGRAYHVIDQWALYKDDPVKIFLPPYSGLGVYGGIVTGTIAAFLYARWKNLPFLRWADIVAPGLFVMQAIARWGNFFNQELYGTPTKLPWGIPIDCAHRIAAYPCSSAYPESTLFHPLFLYESLSGVVGAIALIWLGFHARKSLRPGDLLLLFFVWYGIVRFVLETFRHDNWTFFGVPTAQIVSLLFVIPSLADARVATSARPSAGRSALQPRGRHVGCARATGRSRRGRTTSPRTTMGRTTTRMTTAPNTTTRPTISTRT